MELPSQMPEVPKVIRRGQSACPPPHYDEPLQGRPPCRTPPDISRHRRQGWFAAQSASGAAFSNGEKSGGRRHNHLVVSELEGPNIEKEALLLHPADDRWLTAPKDALQPGGRKPRGG